jgi:2-iminobutanoate/2-iminopropanoate deaminase
MLPPTPSARALAVDPGGAYSLAYEVTGPARTLYIGGQVPVTPEGSVPAGIEAQARQVWANIDRLLVQAGMERRDLVKVTTYLSDRAYREANARVRKEYLGTHLPTLTVIITGIYDPEWLLEIEAVASRPLSAAAPQP